MVAMWSTEEEADRLSARFDRLKIEQGVSKAAFARRWGVPGGASMLNQHIKRHRPMNLDAAIAYATGFGVPLAEISPRLQAEVDRARSAGGNITSPNVSPVAQGLGVPLISWIQAGSWSDVADPFRPGEAEDWLPCPVRHGPRTYCLRVRGDSMHNPGGRPSYSDGDVIFVDPERDANPGDRVIVRLDDQHEATFKQLLVEDGRRLLKALNPEWTPRYIEINGNATITGVVIGKWVPE